jgi:hypothetical protein
MVQFVIVHDKMQQGYRYELTAPVGKAFDPEFKPQLTPKEMLSLRFFGGMYMRDCVDEFPREWITKAKFAEGKKPDASKNYFGVLASQPLSVWRAKGWINEEHDPRGWFQWYCRYYYGRRLGAEDTRQIRRWKAMRRHIAQLQKYCVKGDFSCRTRQRQALLHWAIDSRKL